LSVGGLYFNPAIAKAVLRERWDAVVLAGYAHWTMRAAMLICLARRIPFLIHSDTHQLRPRSWLKRAAKRWLLYPLLRHAAAGLGLGRLQRQYWEQVGLPAERVFTVPLTGHLERFGLADAERAMRRAALRREWAIPDSTVVGMFVGRLVAVKALDVLLAALAGMAPERRPLLVLVGDGPERAKLEAMARQWSLPVRFVGFCENEDVPALLAAADVFVLPSREEGWAIVVAEAMAAGLPVLLSDQVGAAYDLLEAEGNGFAFKAGSVGDLQRALERSVEERARLAEMGRRSRTIIAGWNVETASREFFLALEVALARGKGRGPGQERETAGQLRGIGHPGQGKL
jgi:glycosyltransferase involved in cell wall biosynthesis